MAHVAKYKAPALGHMFAHWDRTGSVVERENIDEGATHLNWTVGPQRRLSDVIKAKEGVSHQDGARAVRKDAVLVADWVFTAPDDLRPDDERRFFEVCYTYCAEQYGRDNLLGGRVHCDEPGARHHMHLPFMPLVCDTDGVLHFDAKHVLSRAHLKGFHAGLQEAVDEALGYHVSVTLDEAQMGQKQLSHLSHTEYVAATHELARAEAEVCDARVRVQHTKDELARLDRERAKSQKGVSQLRQSVTHLTDERDGLRAEVAQARQEADDAREGVSQLRQSVTHLTDERDGLRAEVAREGQRLLEARADRIGAEAAAELAREKALGGVSQDAIEDILGMFAREVAARVIDWWDEARDWARRRWESWHESESVQVGDVLGVSHTRTREISESALWDEARAYERPDVAQALVHGGDDWGLGGVTHPGR